MRRDEKWSSVPCLNLKGRGRLGKQVLGRELEIVADETEEGTGAGGKGDDMDVLEMMMKLM